MKKQFAHTVTGLSAAAILALSAGDSHADPKLRVQVDQRGDFLLIGNTLAQECRNNTPPPVVGNVGECGAFTSETGPDILWRSDSPTDGAAEANINVSPAEARSTAMLEVPEGATITHAFLYWAARLPDAADLQVTLHHGTGDEMVVTAIDSVTKTVNVGQPNEARNYQSVADITPFVQEHGSGTYRVADVDMIDMRNLDDDVLFAAWWMVAFYERPGDTPRNLTLFDGLDRVSMGNMQRVELNGFRVPNAGFEAKLGIIAYEGDNTNTGDRLYFNPTDPNAPDFIEALSDPLNPADNFFNSTRSIFGQPVSVVGDLPQLTGTPQSMSGFDLDIIDVADKLKPGDESATVVGTSDQELYYLGGWITSISTLGPDLSISTKTAEDKNGDLTKQGDVIEYTITLVNAGTDTAVGVVLTDPLPEGVTYVPASMRVVEGEKAGKRTDDIGDDGAEYDLKTRSVIMRLGKGADRNEGGTLAVGDKTVVSFQVTIDQDTSGVVSNQASINYAGDLGAPPVDDLTDSDPDTPGAQTTDIYVEPLPPVNQDAAYGGGSGLFAACSAGRSAHGGLVWLLGGALAGLLARRRRWSA